MHLIMCPVPHHQVAASKFLPCRAKTSMERPNETPRLREGIEVSKAWMRTGTRSGNDGIARRTTSRCVQVSSVQRQDLHGAPARDSALPCVHRSVEGMSRRTTPQTASHLTPIHPTRSGTSALIREVPVGWETTTPFEITRVLEEREARVPLIAGMAQNQEPREMWSIKAREDKVPIYAICKVPARLEKLRSPAPPCLLQCPSSKVGPFDFDSARSRVRGGPRAHQALLQLCLLPRLQLPLQAPRWRPSL